MKTLSISVNTARAECLQVYARDPFFANRVNHHIDGNKIIFRIASLFEHAQQPTPAPKGSGKYAVYVRGSFPPGHYRYKVKGDVLTIFCDKPIKNQ